jgi:thiosulfate/3-mercaptopyruvate sulfurtransferase
VSTQWLADHLGAEGLVVLDATVVAARGAGGEQTFESGLDRYLGGGHGGGHIPGAVFADLIDVFSDPSAVYPFTRPDATTFEAAAESVGIDDSVTVVVYDAAVGQWASRVWWLFRSFGFDRVAVLDGGLSKWTAEERGTDPSHVEPRAVGSFTAIERPESWVEKDFVAGVVDGSERATLLCGVPPKEFSGETSPRSRKGHIPGSISAPAGRLVSRDTNEFLAPAELRQALAGALASDDPIVAYCNGGIAAASDALALALLGRTDVAIYDGSLNEWAADAAAPLV